MWIDSGTRLLKVEDVSTFHSNAGQDQYFSVISASLSVSVTSLGATSRIRR